MEGSTFAPAIMQMWELTSLTEATTSQRPKSIAFPLITLGLDALGVGIIAPIVPGLVQQLAHLPPEQAAPWVGALLAAYAAIQFFAAPLLGALSDRFGRRPVILISVFGIGCDYVLLALAPSLWWLFVGRVIAGATSANVAAVTAYIADVTPLNGRARRFGLIGATFGAGFVIGPAVGGFLGAYGLRLPFYAAAALTFANFLYGLLVLPESLKPADRHSIDWHRANPFGLLRGVWRNPELRRLSLAWACSWTGLGAVQSSLVLFTRYRFGWDAGANGLVLAGIGLSQALVEGVLLARVNARLGEERTALVGYVAGALGYATLAFAVDGWMVAPAIVLLALAGLAIPSVRSMVSGTGGVDHQGEMQGVLTSVEGLTAVIAPLLAAGLFFAFTSPALPIRFAGAPFVLAAIAATVAGTLLRRHLKQT